jgi:hypothetical protein
MRLWTISPSYLDAKGLVALWRESLLAQKVLTGNTVGYTNHPQLLRFKNTRNPSGAIASYLRCIVEEADLRGYNFDKNKIINKSLQSKIEVTQGQIEYEFTHLLKKLKHRDPLRHSKLVNIKQITIHPLFEPIKGEIEEWEII